jgi:cbb3-type cytochrome oxidase maturation protein
VSENIVILMIGVSTFLGALGLIALIWAVKTGQFDDHSKFIDAVRHDNEEDLQDAAMMTEKKKQYQEKRELKKKESHKQNYMPPD